MQGRRADGRHDAEGRPSKTPCGECGRSLARGTSVRGVVVTEARAVSFARQGDDEGDPMTRHATTEPQQDVSLSASLALLGGLLAVILSFFAPSFAIVVALIVIVVGVIALIRARRGRPGRGPAIAGIILAVIALLIGAATSPDAEAGFQEAVSAPDPNALPATVVIADVRSPEHLVTTEGRQLHVTMMRGRAATDPCRAGSDLATARQLVIGQTVSVALPDATRTDAAAAVPPGFQPVVMTLANGFDYAQMWQSRAANAWSSACAPPPAPAVGRALVDPVPSRPRGDRDSSGSDSSDDDRVATRAPASREAAVPRTREPSATRPRTGQSGHLCRPGERDGDKDGYCGE
ncbi:hypothetical protein [Actinomycetospora soli]|uniref:hypothetical protein n=1 Tax=Actinomycetospora soli TaxID=2893887 RepID=UPI001E2CC945|nr:hypothetical protein [Actinomycetospora soli]MCD2187887.1 hypothetical protein [Actinomycetospora soli]